MNRWDLDKLELLLSAADRVVPMRELAADPVIDPMVIGLRHDVDDNPRSLETAFEMAEWENERGYRSSYYLLHTARYWKTALESAYAFELLDHEVGIHVNAVAEGLRRRENPELILGRAVDELRAAGVTVTGGVAHGDQNCYWADGRLQFVNDEMFLESTRPSLGTPDRILHLGGSHHQLSPVSRREFGLEYDPNWLPRGDYLSDSGGSWSQPFEEVAARWPLGGQLHLLVHPDWWAEAFAGVTA